MSKVAVVTDSCASIPESLIQALNIDWVPYYIHRGGEELRDLVRQRSLPNFSTNSKEYQALLREGQYLTRDARRVADRDADDITSFEFRKERHSYLTTIQTPRPTCRSRGTMALL